MCVCMSERHSLFLSVCVCVGVCVCARVCANRGDAEMPLSGPHSLLQLKFMKLGAHGGSVYE